jgi:hypothetical protein
LTQLSLARLDGPEAYDIGGFADMRSNSKLLIWRRVNARQAGLTKAGSSPRTPIPAGLYQPNLRSPLASQRVRTVFWRV